MNSRRILLFRTLTWLRRFGQPGPEGILDAPERLPLLEVATRTTFLLLAEEPEREVVVGTLVVADVAAGDQTAGGSGGFATNHFLATK
jgi:hypothetical protein